MKPEKIIIVYNAEDGLINAVFDWGHKYLSPETYECALCRFTYSLLGMRLPWKQFLESLPHEKDFLHRPQFRRQYPWINIRVPAILVEAGGAVAQLVSADEIEAAENLAGLIQITRTQLWEIERAAALPENALSRP